MATAQEIQTLAELWSPVVQAYCEAVDGGRLEFVPKGDPDSIASLLANWSQAIPNTYAEPTEAQLLTALGVVQATIDADGIIDTRQASAKTDFSTLPGWAGWTIAELNAYIETNIGDTEIDAITNLAEAKAMLKVMANIMLREGQAIIVLRNAIFPDLEGN